MESATCCRRSRDESSAQCASSKTIMTSRSCDSRRSSRSTASNSRKRSSPVPVPLAWSCSLGNRSGASRASSAVRPCFPARAGRLACCPKARKICRHGQYGGAPPASGARPHTTMAPTASATAHSSSASRVLPIPGSPRQRIRRGRPASPAARHCSSTSRSRSRPTNAVRIGALLRPTDDDRARRRRPDTPPCRLRWEPILHPSRGARHAFSAPQHSPRSAR